jgi:hypothetical protein
VESTGSTPLFSVDGSGVSHDSMLRDIDGFVESDEAGVPEGGKALLNPVHFSCLVMRERHVHPYVS